MKTLWAKRALLDDGWAENVTVNIGPNGRILSVESGSTPTGYQVKLLLPAPVNVHSHAFQRAMAGLSERRGPEETDSFWTWRELMYRFLDRLGPEDVEAIAAWVQLEMLEAGYGASVEFHYLHHQPGGKPYDNLGELSQSVTSAADQSGIGLTLLPVMYQHGGCDGRSLHAGQVRFGNNLDRYLRLCEIAGTAIDGLPADCTSGFAPHSLRAVASDTLHTLADLSRENVLHMHLAEQPAEVEEVRQFLGARPVEWLVDNLALDPRWCLVHCTQMLPHETRSLAKTGIVAGLCPITESSLGDGIFDGKGWKQHGGRFAIGSDSNIRISLVEELRTLEYSQRLLNHQRSVFATSDKSTGRSLFDAVCNGGAQAAGRQCGAIRSGLWADLLSLDADHVDLISKRGDTLLDGWIFAGSDDLVCDVWSAGRHLVQEGTHVNREKIEMRYRQVLARLGDVL